MAVSCQSNSLGCFGRRAEESSLVVLTGAPGACCSRDSLGPVDGFVPKFLDDIGKSEGQDTTSISLLFLLAFFGTFFASVAFVAVDDFAMVNFNLFVNGHSIGCPQ